MSSGARESDEALQPTVGAALRAARVARRESLAQVAAATGISKSLLSLIENDRSDVTVRRLVLLAEHYGKHLSDLLPSTAPPDPVVTRRRDRRRIASPEEGLDAHVLVSDSNRKMMPIVVVFQPGGKDAELWRHEGEEFVVVLEGRLLLEVEGSPPIVLEQGDSAYYDAPRPHRWSNIGDGVTRVLSVATPPTTL